MNPDLDDVYVNRDGTIRWDGEPVGYVHKIEGLAPAGAKWRAEIGNPAKPEEWPPFRAVYTQTRKEAVAAVLDSVEAPEGEESHG